MESSNLHAAFDTTSIVVVRHADRVAIVRAVRRAVDFSLRKRTTIAVSGCSLSSVARSRAHRSLLMTAMMCVMVLVTPTIVRADVAKDAAIRGNNFFESGQFKEAAAAYQLARDGGYSTPQVRYNQACAMVELGELSDAEQLFKTVDADPASGNLAASARFNLGSLAYRQAQAMLAAAHEAQAGQPGVSAAPPEGIIDLLRKSERGFRGAYELIPSDHEAARNIEVVQRAIRQIKDQIEAQKKQQQQGDRQQQESDGKSSQQNKDNKSQNSDKQQDDKNAKGGTDQQQNKDQKKEDKNAQQQQKNEDQNGDKQAPASAQEQLSDLAKKQQELAQETKKTAQDRNDSQQGKADAPTEQPLRDQEAVEREKQRELSKQTEEALKKLEEEARTNASPEEKKRLEEAARKAEQAQKAQQRADQALKNHMPDKASEEQQRAAELIQQAADATDQPQPQPDAREQKPQPPEAQDSKQPNEPKNDMMAARILDKERREAVQKAMRSLRLRAKAAPVLKDW